MLEILPRYIKGVIECFSMAAEWSTFRSKGISLLRSPSFQTCTQAQGCKLRFHHGSPNPVAKTLSECQHRPLLLFRFLWKPVVSGRPKFCTEYWHHCYVDLWTYAKSNLSGLGSSVEISGFLLSCSGNLVYICQTKSWSLLSFDKIS